MSADKPIGERQRRWRSSLHNRNLREIRLAIPQSQEPAIRALAAWLREHPGDDWRAIRWSMENQPVRIVGIIDALKIV